MEAPWFNSQVCGWRDEELVKIELHLRLTQDLLQQDIRIASYSDKVWNCLKSNKYYSLPMDRKLDLGTYRTKFLSLLDIEQATQDYKMRAYDKLLAAKKITRIGHIEDGALYEFEAREFVTGNLELLRGSELVVRPCGGRRNFTRGKFEKICNDKFVFLTSPEDKLEDIDRTRYDVFLFNSSISTNRCKAVVNYFANHHQKERTLFPERPINYARPLIDIKELRCLTGSNFNQCQRDAIIGALRAQCRPSPYLILGPPGTGKTKTIIEAIVQILTLRPKFQILVAANSNVCADMLARLLMKSGHVGGGLVRLIASYRIELNEHDRRSVPKDLKPICRTVNEIEESYSIIVATSNSTYRLYEVGKSFDYVFIDEAARSFEPETLIPMSVQKPRGATILTGDPFQLGPYVFNRGAQKAGLSLSLMERLIRMDLYHLVHGDERYRTMLNVNYRSDPRIMCISNEIWYLGNLECTVKSRPALMKKLKLNHPLAFHQVEGAEVRGPQGFSWINLKQANVCIEYLKFLKGSNLFKDYSASVGIVTYYKAQIQLIKQLLQENHMKCKVDTTEAYQGDEKKLIIVSLVRSCGGNPFLHDAKRFNVSISRAEWSAIVVGDPRAVDRGIWWAQYKDHADKLQSYPWKQNFIPRTKQASAKNFVDGWTTVSRRR